MIKTGFFGGSFNPVHYGHLSLARQLMEKVGLDEVWFVVSPQNPLKKSEDLLDDDKRLAMLRLALDGDERLKACDYEFRLPRPSYTWTTLCRMRYDYPDHAFTLLIGSDNWRLFPRWYHYEDILGNYPVVIYPRKGDKVDATGLPEHVTLADTELINVSSTEIRQRIREGRSIRRLVPAAVAEMIQKERLYV